MKFKYILFGLVVLFMTSCTGLKKVKKFNKEKAVLGLKKEASSGPFSVYNLYIYPKGYVVYEGLVNVEKYGLYAKKIKKVDIEALKTAFDKSDFFGFKDTYSMPSSDLPVITLIYNKEKNRKKQVVGSIERPKKLMELQLLLEKIAKSEDMVMVEEYEVQKRSENVQEELIVDPDYKIESEIIIETLPGTFLAQWLRKYAEYDINLVTKISDELNLWLISYNTQKINPQQMLEKLKADSSIKNAEFNKKVSSRNK